MNCDFKKANAHDLYLSNLISYHDMFYVWQHENANCDYTYCDYHNDSYSCIDHFILSNNLRSKLQTAFVVSCPLNPSRHMPIVVQLTLKCEVITVINENTQRQDRIAWYQVNDQQISEYQAALDRILSLYPDFSCLYCDDVTCSLNEHFTDIDKLCELIIKCCLCTDNVFPRINCSNVSKIVPGWKQHVREYREESLFWFNLWKSQGQPQTGILFNNMKEAKRQYLYAVRRVKRRKLLIRNTRLATCIANNRDRDFFKEVKRMNAAKHVAPSINGLQNSLDIANHFADKYRDLFNSVPSDNVAIDNMKSKIKCNITNSINYVPVVYSDVIKAVNSLKHEKNDGDKGLTSNHLLYGSTLYFEVLTKLINACFVHGYQPDCLSLSTIVSIPKDQHGDICSDVNYRGISLCSSICKVFDYIMINRNTESLKTSPQQYAYKEYHGTTLCTLMVKETVNHYLNNGSNVYSVFLDATKAFDRVCHDKLFNILYLNGMNNVDLRYLMSSYEKQMLRVTWRNCNSSEFHPTNGIGQGRVASPILFCLYLDILLNRLVSKGVGCWIGNHYAGTFAYADDVTLLCPTISGLQLMLSICDEFAKEFDVKFNASKSISVTFAKKQQEFCNVYLNGVKLKCTNNVKHLGNYLSYNLDEKCEINCKKNDLIRRVNNILCTFCGVDENVMLKIFYSQCCHFYGAQAWLFDCSATAQFHTMYNRCVRRLLNLPFQTHTRYLPFFTGRSNSIDLISSRFVKMLKNSKKCDNDFVYYILNFNMKNNRTIVGNNVKYIERLCKLDIMKLTCCSIKALYKGKASVEDRAIISAINDLRNEGVYMAGFTASERKDLATYLCVN